MKTIVRKNEEAVSPVIATILMVAITVVLAAVLYVMVSGLITSPGNTQKLIVGTVTISGGNWIVTFTSVPAGITPASVSVSVTTSAGVSTNVTAVALSALSFATNGMKYQAAGTTGNIAPADSLLISQAWWAAGYRVTMTNSGQIIYGPTTLQ